jgi:hypothetical protein
MKSCTAPRKAPSASVSWRHLRESVPKEECRKPLDSVTFSLHGLRFFHVRTMIRSCDIGTESFAPRTLSFEARFQRAEVFEGQKEKTPPASYPRP